MRCRLSDSDAVEVKFDVFSKTGVNVEKLTKEAVAKIFTFIDKNPQKEAFYCVGYPQSPVPSYYLGE